MYWTHLIFALILGHLLQNDLITADKPGYLDFDNLPETNFSCKNKVIGGYYADVETGCQMFHVCTIGQKGEVTDIKFLCLNGTVFDQETRVCERIDEVDCSKSEDFFNLNLELYGNQAGGIQAEEEFFCEDCSTEEDDYDLSAEVTVRTTPSTTTTTTTTSKPTTTTVATSTAPPTAKVIQHYPTSSPETIAALLALHNAFTQSVQNPKVKPPPPRVINNAFASLTPSTPKTTYYSRPQVTQLPPRDDSYDDDNHQQNYRQQNRVQDHRISDHYSHHGHSTLSPSQVRDHHKTNFYPPTTPANLKNNFHHFQSGDTGFVHSFDTGKQYNYHYFNPRRTPEPTAKASVSIVTSTSTSTSVRASKQNSTQLELTAPGDDFPTGYDDYPDDSIDEAFFRDVPKIRSKRSDQKPQPRHANHRYPDEVSETTTRHPNHRYEGATVNPTLEAIAAGNVPEEEAPTQREEFLQNLLGSLDMDEHDRQRVARLFKVEEKEMDGSAGVLQQLGNKLGELIMDDINKTIHQAQLDEKNSSQNAVDLNKINEMWQHHYEEMSQEVDLKFDIGSDRGRRDAENKEKLMVELEQDYALTKSKIESVKGSLQIMEKSRAKRQVKGLDTEKFRADYEPRKRTRPRPTERPQAATTTTVGPVKDIVPVFEEVDEGDFTTRPYLRPTLKPRLTTRAVDSTTKLRFNYEITTPAPSATFRRRNQGRSALAAEPKLAAPSLATVPNVTRDVTKLRDVPVYEEEYDSGEVTIPQKQDFSTNQKTGLREGNSGFIQFSNGQIAFKVPAQVPTTDVQFEYQPVADFEATDEPISISSPAELEEVPTKPPGRPQKPSTRRRIEGRVDNQPRSSQQSESLLDNPVDGHTRVTIRSRARLAENVDKMVEGSLSESRRRPGSQQRGEVRQQRRPPARIRSQMKERFQVTEDKIRDSEIPPIPETTQQRVPPPSVQLNVDSVPIPIMDDLEVLEIQTEARQRQQKNGNHNHATASLSTRYDPQPVSVVSERIPGGRGLGYSPDEVDPTEHRKRPVVYRGKVRGTLRSTTPPNEPPPAPPMDPSLVPDPTFSCEGKIKGSFYADLSNDCKGFFICSQGQINGPLLKSHFWCGTNTKFNQRSRTCQAEDLVECSVSERYYHLNQDFAIPETEEQLKPTFEPQRTRG